MAAFISQRQGVYSYYNKQKSWNDSQLSMGDE